MDTLTGIKVFRKVVESGSFVRAADRLEMSTSMVSKHVMHVEARLGVRLLNRNSRTLSLTEVGRAYFERCRGILEELEETELELGSLGASARGTLRLTCPSWFANQRGLADVLSRFLLRYPEIVLDASFEDRMTDLVEEGYDLALRVLTDPRLLPAGFIARPVRSVPFYVGASREYLKRHGAPQCPEDLARHGCVAVGAQDCWKLHSPKGNLEVPARVVARYRSRAGVANAIAAGIGLAPLPCVYFEDPIFKDELIPVLTDFPVAEATLYAVYVSRKHVPRKIRSFIDFLLEVTTSPEAHDRTIGERAPSYIKKLMHSY